MFSKVAMQDAHKTKAQLIAELQELRRRLEDSQAAEAEIQRQASFPQLNPNPVIELDATGAVTFTNEATLTTLQALGESAGPEAFLPPDIEDILKAVQEGGEERFSREVRIQGAVFAEDISYVAPFGALRLYARDITGYRRAEEALRESQKDLNRAQAVAHTGSWRLNVQRNELLWSDETYRIFGLPPSQPLTYETFLAAVHAEDRDYVDRKWQAALLGEPYDIEHRIVVGEIVKWVRERAELEFDAQGSLIGGFGTAEDITARKRAEENLRRSEAQMQTIFDNLTEGLVASSLDGDLLHWNPAAVKMHGFASLEECQRRLPEFTEIFELSTLEGDILPLEQWPLARILRGETLRDLEIRLRRLNSEWQAIFNYGGALVRDADGQPLLAVVTVKDVTKRKHSEEALLRSNQRLDLLAGIAGQLLTSDSPQQIIDSLCQRVMEFLDCDAFFNFLVNEQKKCLELNACAGIPEEEARRIKWLPYGVAVCGCAARDGCRIVTEDILNRDDSRTELVKSYGIQAYACHPLITQGRVLGTLSFGTLKRPHFTGDELALMQAVADQVAIAIDRQQSAQALQEAHNDLELRVEERTIELEETVAQLEEEVADRQRAEEFLRRQAELLDLAHDAIIVRDLNSRVTFWSRGAEETYGWKRQEALGQSVHILLQTQFPFPREEIEQKVLHQGRWAGELTQARADGTSMIVASRWALQLDEVKQPAAMLEINRDITQRRRAEKILEARLGLLKLAESHPLADFPQATLDELERLTNSTISFFHLVEPDQQTLSLQNWSTNTLNNMCSAEGQGRHYDLAEAGVWADCVRQRRPVVHNNYEALPHRRGLPPGHAPVMRELVVPIFREDQIVALIGVGNKPSDYDEGDVELVSLLGDFWWDIIERKRAEEELAKRTARVQDLYNNAPCGYHSLDQEGRFVQINDTELAWLGYSREELLGGMKFPDLLTPASREAFLKLFPGFLERGWIRDIEYELIRKDGSILPVLVNATAIRDEAGRFLMSRGTIVDLTERKRAEQALEAERRRFFAVLERIPAYVALIAPDGQIPFANREFIRRFGDPGNRRCHEFLHGLAAPCEGCKPMEVLETGIPAVWEMDGPDRNIYQIYTHPFIDADGSPLVLELGVDISHLKSIESGVRRQSAILDGINRIFREAMTCETEMQLGRTCLAVTEELTGAEFGTVYEVNPRGLLDALVVSERGWAACRMENPGDYAAVKNLPVRGLYRRVIQDGISMIINDPENHPDRLGAPEGHPALTALLQVPLWHGDTVMGLLCLGNKAGGFQPSDQEAAETLAAATVEALRRFRAEKQAATIGRLYRVLSRVNEVIVRAPDQETLFAQTCRIAVREGGFLMAWIGLIDPAVQAVRAVAHSGSAEGYLDNLLIPVAEVPESQGPTGVAARQGRIDICKDFALEPRMAPWREQAMARGYRSSAAFPLRVGEQVVGALTLYAGTPEFFNQDEVALLESLASDLSFALDSLDREAKRQQAEEEVYRLNEELEDRVRERTSELEFANREMESFSYSVSHDLKAPLRAIQGFSRMLQEEHAFRLDAEALRLLRVIISNTQTMAKLIDDLLALSRLGRQQVRKSTIDLAAMARQIFEQFKTQEPERDLQLTLSDLPPAWGDYALLHQVIANLLDNAVKYTRACQNAMIEMGGYSEGREDIFFVKDNGVGFDERYVHKLFGVFQRLHGGTEYEGTGVGLAIVQRIIQRHGGRVWAAGQTGQGANFFFALPRKEPAPANPEVTSYMAPDRTDTVNLYTQADQESLSLESRFRFHCQPGLACFNQCCGTPTILLSPYDILRLRQGLGITSGEFLRRYTRQEADSMSGLPLIFLDAFRSPEGGCPFVGPEGCQVYAQRPAACRLFPITMGSRLTEEGLVDYYFYRRLDYCRGFDGEVEWTVASWQANQGFPEFDRGRREWLAILLQQALQGPVKLPPQIQALLPVVAYDLDEFRRLLLQPGGLPGCDLEARQLTELATDDLLLLQLAYRYLRSLLFTSEPA